MISAVFSNGNTSLAVPVIGMISSYGEWELWKWNDWLICVSIYTIYIYSGFVLLRPKYLRIYSVILCDDQRMVNWEEFGKKRSWTNLRRCPGTCLKGLKAQLNGAWLGAWLGSFYVKTDVIDKESPSSPNHKPRRARPDTWRVWIRFFVNDDSYDVKLAEPHAV
jgi:hypothetical protein